jgi:anti-sigma B factor antagonist
MKMALKCTIRRTDDVTILDINGRLTLGEELAFGSGSGIVLSENIRELAKKGQKKIVLNLAEVNYVDSSGVGQLVGALTTARKQGANIKLLAPPPRVLDLLRMNRLDTLFNIQENEAEAIQSFSQNAAASA